MSVKTLARQTAIYGLSSIGSRLINWGLTPLYTYYLTTGEYGVYSDLLTFAFYGIVVLTFGLETAYFNYYPKSRNGDRIYATAFSWILLLSSIFLLLSLPFHVQIAGLMGYGNDTQLVWMLLLITALDSLGALPMAALRMQERAVRFASITLSHILLMVALNLIFFLTLEPTVFYIFLANLFASGLRLALSLHNNLPRLKLVERRTLSLMCTYGFWFMVSGMLGVMSVQLDRNLITRLWPDGQLWQGKAYTGAELNGIYSAIYKVAIIITLFTTAYRAAAEPFLFRQAKKKNSLENTARIFNYFTMIKIFIMLVTGCLAYEIVSFNGFGLLSFSFIHPDYWPGLQAVPLLLAANVFWGAHLSLGIWYKVKAKLNYALLISAVGAVVTIGLNSLLIPYMGFMGAAVATLVSYATLAILSYKWGNRYYPVPYQVNRLLVYGLIAFALVWGFMELTLAGYTQGWFSLLKIGCCVAFIWIVRRLERNNLMRTHFAED
ncbi:MAG: oligosaccharide flippase family protein [Bacteroidetes bacterium]|jgi:O-antigen/teichoic acid export membrane protein|nr:oligosaccharide flippase family protein [Bacteroidota bacterium]